MLIPKINKVIPTEIKLEYDLITELKEKIVQLENKLAAAHRWAINNGNAAKIIAAGSEAKNIELAKLRKENT